jgi:uracil-DNA glycosylase
MEEILNLMFDHGVHSSWTEFFVRNSDLILDITKKILDGNKSIVPEKSDIFKVFRTSLYDIRIVLLGMDPYPNPANAMGLAFSVPKSTPIPGSLCNIFRELKQEFPERHYEFEHGDLSRWVDEEGIFLLNCSLTTVAWKTGMHIAIWKPFSDALIAYISKRQNVVFILLGNHAIQKRNLILYGQNIVTATHPSPLSAHNGFFGSDAFRKAEKILGKTINWSI